MRHIWKYHAGAAQHIDFSIQGTYLAIPFTPNFEKTHINPKPEPYTPISKKTACLLQKLQLHIFAGVCQIPWHNKAQRVQAPLLLSTCCAKKLSYVSTWKPKYIHIYICIYRISTWTLGEGNRYAASSHASCGQSSMRASVCTAVQKGMEDAQSGESTTVARHVYRKNVRKLQISVVGMKAPGDICGGRA